MGQSLPAVRERASNVVAEFRDERPNLKTVAATRKWFPSLSKDLWPGKTAASVHVIVREPERSCYDWVAGKCDPPARVFIRMLHSDQGWRVLEYLMDGCKQRWWLDLVEDRRKARILDRTVEAVQGTFNFG